MSGAADKARHVVVMGVSGVGKTTVATGLADGLGVEYAEGDEFHPRANIEKMSAGVPLEDEDRWPWLESLARWTAEKDAAGETTVVTCSALKRSYRDVLRDGAPRTFFVHLTGSEELIRSRIEGREHFMPASLLRSQFDTLEPLEPDEAGVELDVTNPPDEIVRAALEELDEQV
jgi:carbohydrate kinase (thermoresistant glucokinase family)